MKLVNNKYMLYLVALFALIINLGNLTMLKFDLVILFAIVGLITYYYTKNMIIVLSLPILFICLYNTFIILYNNKEGFKEGLKKREKKKKIKENMSDNQQSSTTNSIGENNSSGSSSVNTVKKRSNFANKNLNPKILDTIPSKKKILDQTGDVDKIEQAYDSLDNALGSNSIRSINSKTTDLIKEQKEMLGQIKEITPTLEKALQSVAKIDLNKVLTTFDGMNKSLGSS